MRCTPRPVQLTMGDPIHGLIGEDYLLNLEEEVRGLEFDKDEIENLLLVIKEKSERLQERLRFVLQEFDLEVQNHLSWAPPGPSDQNSSLTL